MASLDWQLHRPAEVTLVELRVTSDCRERVALRSNLEPVWPPRRQGRPANGWQETGFEGVVTPAEPLVLGYASPAEPVDPPAELTDCEPVVTDADPAGDSAASGDTLLEKLDDDTAGRALVRALGAGKPPRGAVPNPRGPAATAGEGPPAESAGDSPGRIPSDAPEDDSTLADIGRQRDGAEARSRADCPGELGEAAPTAGDHDRPVEGRTLADQLAADRLTLLELADRYEDILTVLDRTDEATAGPERGR